MIRGHEFCRQVDMFAFRYLVAMRPLSSPLKSLSSAFWSYSGVVGSGVMRSA